MKVMKRIFAYGLLGWLAYEVGTFVVMIVIPFIIYKLVK